MGKRLRHHSSHQPLRQSAQGRLKLSPSDETNPWLYLLDYHSELLSLLRQIGEELERDVDISGVLRAHTVAGHLTSYDGLEV